MTTKRMLLVAGLLLVLMAAWYGGRWVVAEQRHTRSCKSGPAPTTPRGALTAGGSGSAS
ncbi:MAG: hypothetical protein Q8O40_15940 [Chloroflexota bacterium]|nr:hypothetical protein [Chloroflexota bacterium]